jgi:predicted nucleic acid-binding protein
MTMETIAQPPKVRRHDKDWTLCDAISFAVLETHRVARAFTFDHRFRQYGRIQVLGLGQ